MMLDTILRLKEIEMLAQALYSEAAGCFDANAPRLAQWLRKLAEDEAEHVRLMEKCEELVKEGNINFYITETDTILPEEETFRVAREYFNEARSALKQSEGSVDAIFKCIVKAESLEWNGFFVFVIRRLAENVTAFQHEASRIQNHLFEIEKELPGIPGGSRFLGEIRRLPPVWDKKMLVVEDSAALRFMYASCFESRFHIDTAQNGREGLEKVRKNYFDIILSDIEMPEMDGLQFYQKTIDEFPAMASSFIFLTGESDLKEFFIKNKLPYMMKPISLKPLRTLVEERLRGK